MSEEDPTQQGEDANHRGGNGTATAIFILLVLFINGCFKGCDY